MKRRLRAAAITVVKDYWNGWMYTFVPSEPPPADASVRCAPVENLTEVASSQDEKLRRMAWQGDADAWLFGAWVGGDLAALCWFQARETHRKRSGWFRLRDDEAELAQITTAARYQGRGIATELIRSAAWQMSLLGFRRLYAKIWHDNDASVRAFRRAGWKCKKRFVSLRFRWVPGVLSITLPS